MCNSLYLPETGQDIDSIGGLRRLIAPIEVVWGDGYAAGDVASEESCLCPIDMAATARAAGFEEIEHDSDPMMSMWGKLSPLDHLILGVLSDHHERSAVDIAYLLRDSAEAIGFEAVRRRLRFLKVMGRLRETVEDGEACWAAIERG
jgi:Ribonuclease R winged-helix domain